MKNYLFAALLALGISSSGSALTVGERIPDISLPKIGSSGSFSLSSLQGKVTLVDFWGSWCIPCRASFPIYDQLRNQYQGKGFEVVGINEDDQVSSAQDFLNTYVVSFTILHDEKKEAASVFKPNNMPTSFLVDRQGKVVKVYSGFRESDVPALKQDIENLLG
ncbi:MAG: TlpA family protein disulfide reductase [Caedimonadaceae bacterium]|nr:MAG: TlpA family protein disulfide reductase [Caedimonadaceae bacterium]